ncbi:MAG: beta-lactamase family protein [Synergistaceae bacterium]|jgi:CubicO group peptidase (beta-lactamase class C family)|nr:beta-lactamase family protein [Synergistaceae bacterium]
MRSKIFVRLLLAAAFLQIFCAAPHFLGEACAAARNAQRRPTEEQREFSSFIDGFLAGVQKERRIPGMSFAAVHNGETLYMRGYGVEDLASGTQVDPERTAFRAGSISLPVTASAVMQLAEQRRIVLDEDVNIYLRRWKIPDAFDEPITLRHLLTNTSGLDYRELETAAPTSADELAYAARLRKTFPARYAPPGRFYCPSNMGYALLGAIIERYSRLNFDAAIRKHIFQPLGMTSSAFSPNEAEMKNLATGYDERGRTVSYEYRYDLPATGMSTTAADMARFMAAQLAGGALGRSRILNSTFSGSMMRRHFSPHPKINGTGLGYLEKPVSGLRTLQQRCDIPGYSGFMMLIPEKNFGMYFATNVSGIDFSGEMADAVVKRFFPPSGDAGSPSPSGATAIYPDIRGFYRSNMISRSTAEKASRMFSDQIEVSLGESFLTVRHTRKKGAPPTRWVPAAGSDDLFRRAGEDGAPSDEYMFFQRDSDGLVCAAVIGGVENTYDRLKTYESHYWQMAMIAGFFAAAALSFLGTFAGAAINKGKFPWESGLRSDTELWGISSIFCAVQITYALGMLASILLVGSEFRVFVPYQVKALFLAPLAGGLLLAWLWFRLLAKLLNPDYHWLEHAAIMSIAFAETGYMFFLADWRLLGFMF